MNIRDLDYNNKMGMIENLNYESDISPEVIKLMAQSLEQNKYKFENNSLEELKK